MNRSGAFRDKPALQKLLLQDLKSDDNLWQRWFGLPFNHANMKEIAEKYGVDAALVYLMRELVHAGDTPEVRQFVDDLISAIVPGTSVLDIIRRWYIWGWHDAPSNIRDRIEGTAFRTEAATILGLVEQSLTETVTAKAWRNARSALSKASGEAADQEPLSDLISSMAWDLEQAPGASADVASSWGKVVADEAMLRLDWPPERQKRLQTLALDAQKRVVEELGIKSREDSARLRTEFKARFDAILAGDDESASLLARSAAVAQAREERRQDWLIDIRKGIIDEAGAAAAALTG